MELKDAMNKRRSIRKYQKKEVSDAMIETLIEAAIQAPTWKNSQTGRYHVVRSQQMLEKLKSRETQAAEPSWGRGVVMVTTQG